MESYDLWLWLFMWIFYYFWLRAWWILSKTYTDYSHYVDQVKKI